MRVGLFIPCYIDQFYPQVGIAALELLEKLGCEVHYPLRQTCCGQPLANSGLESEAMGLYKAFAETFEAFDYTVAPSGSCTYHVRRHYDIIPQDAAVAKVRKRTFDLVEFLVDILKIDQLDSRFHARVGLHHSCHGLRGLRLGRSSELVGGDFSKIKTLLSLVDEIEVIEPGRKDECCGFGGTFSVNEPELSLAMGKDCIDRHLENKVDYITAGDMSCLMHLEGILRKMKSPVRVIHIAEILNHTTNAAP